LPESSIVEKSSGEGGAPAIKLLRAKTLSEALEIALD
jgi:hypothetical protein